MGLLLPCWDTNDGEDAEVNSTTGTISMEGNKKISILKEHGSVVEGCPPVTHDPTSNHYNAHFEAPSNLTDDDKFEIKIHVTSENNNGVEANINCEIPLSVAGSFTCGDFTGTVVLNDLKGGYFSIDFESTNFTIVNKWEMRSKNQDMTFTGMCVGGCS